MNITIRKCLPEDLEKLREISIQTFVAAFGTQNTKENMDAYLSKSLSLEHVQKELNNPDSKFYFAEMQAEPIGYLKINTGNAQSEAMGDDAIEIERIYLLPEMKGKGIGKLLMEKAYELARAKEKTKIWLGVWDKNQAAIAFYEKAGFKTFSKHNFYLGSDLQTDLLMEKML